MCKYLSPQLTSSKAGFLVEEVLALTLVVLVASALAVGCWWSAVGEGPWSLCKEQLAQFWWAALGFLPAYTCPSLIKFPSDFF